MSHVLGIDFGTSNSAAGVVLDAKVQIIPLEDGASTLPTAVFFDFESQMMRVGARAAAALLEGQEGRYMRGLKSLLGTQLMREKRLLLGERIDFIEIVARFLGQVKSRAEAATGRVYDRALSGRPVQFHTGDVQRNKQALADLTEAYLRAGFAEVRFMNEPEAAALANRAALTPGDLGLVVDIGGGTSDFTLFQHGGGDEIEILASHGIRVGGSDFDRKLSIARVMPQLGKGSEIRHAFGGETHLAPNAIFNDLATWAKIPFLYGPDTMRAAKELEKFAVHPQRFRRLVKVLDEELGHDIAFAVEAGKISANDPDAVEPGIMLEMLKKGGRLSLTPEFMRRKLSKLSEEIGMAAVQTLEQREYAPDQIAKLIFVGGSSRMGVVEDAMKRRFPDASLHRGHALTAIVEGLAIGSATAFAEPSGALRSG